MTQKQWYASLVWLLMISFFTASYTLFKDHQGSRRVSIILITTSLGAITTLWFLARKFERNTNAILKILNNGNSDTSREWMIQNWGMLSPETKSEFLKLMNTSVGSQIYGPTHVRDALVSDEFREAIADSEIEFCKAAMKDLIPWEPKEYLARQKSPLWQMTKLCILANLSWEKSEKIKALVNEEIKSLRTSLTDYQMYITTRKEKLDQENQEIALKMIKALDSDIARAKDLFSTTSLHEIWPFVKSAEEFLHNTAAIPVL